MMQTPVPPYPPVLDPNHVFNEIVPIIVVVVVVMACTAAVRAIFRSPVGEALAERIRQRSAHRWGVATEDPQRVAALEQQVSQLQGQVSELAERLDFAERMLAERRVRKLGAGQ
jgi:TolA-binding protein